MELLAGGDCRKRIGGDYSEDVNPFDVSDGGCEWMYGGRQSGSVRPQGDDDDDALATLADLASPPQKLKPIRRGVKSASEDRHPLDILAGTLDSLPEMEFLGDGAPLGSKIADVEGGEQLKSGFEMEFQGRSSWDTSSSVDSDSDSSPGIRKRKRKTREKLEHFLEKLVGSMMKRQEKMHNQLIKAMEKMEHERICREEAWRQQDMERMKQNEEARKQEMQRSLSLISFLRTVTGEDIDIPRPSDPAQTLQNLPQQCQDKNFGSAKTQVHAKFRYSSGTRWPREEVQALISARSEVEEKTGIHKGVIWNEISARMKEKGYERSAKKCKEKWENMNKYYKRVTEGGKKQPEHSKTRPYFAKLEDLYKTNTG